MKFEKTGIGGLYTIEMELLEDDRGFFGRVFCSEEMESISHNSGIVQINHSSNKKKGTLRGLHYQVEPYGEIKIVKCIRGAVFDVVVDIRKDSKTFLKWFGVELSGKNMKMLYIPKGFAHGFLTLENDSELIYFHSNFYHKESERALRYNDPALDIKWPASINQISQKDLNNSLIGKDFEGIEV